MLRALDEMDGGDAVFRAAIRVKARCRISLAGGESTKNLVLKFADPMYE